MGGRLFVVGGFDGSGNDLASVAIFDGSAWSAGPPLPVALDHPAVAAMDDGIYVVGGFNNGTASARVFNLANGGAAWVELAPLQIARGAAAVVSPIPHRLIVIGGKKTVAGGEVDYPEIYDTGTQVWAQAPQKMPTPRDHLAGFAYQGLACVAGGRAPATSVRVDCVDPSGGTWQTLPDLPVPTSGAGAVAAGSVVTVGGGEDAGETGIVPTVYRLVNGSWTAEAMFIPRHGFQLVSFGERLWAAGGGVAPGIHPTADCTSIASGL